MQCNAYNKNALKDNLFHLTMAWISWNKFFALAVLSAVAAIVVKLKYFPKQLSLVNEPSTSVEYDFVIIGGGTAGSVLAGKLTEDPRFKVLLMEAGSSESWLSHVPALAPLQMLTDAIWDYETEPEANSHRGFYDGECNIPRGKFLGGSGGMNFHIHNISSAETNPLLKDALHQPEKSVLLDAFLAVGSAIHNGEFSPVTSLIKAGRRHGAAEMFLRPAMNRPNLHVLLNTEVMKFGVENGRVVNVVYSKKRKISTFKIGKKTKVLLTAGSLNTPLLLMRSGFGPKKNLEEFEIPVVKELPVGQTFKDSIMFPVYFHVDDARVKTLNPLTLLNPKEIYNYFRHGKGALTTLGIDGQALFRDEGIFVLLFRTGALNDLIATAITNHRTDTFNELYPGSSSFINTKDGFSLLATCLDPKSQGSLSLTRMIDNEGSPLRIYTNYLSDSEDVACLKKAVRKAVAIGEALKSRIPSVKLHVPDFKECRSYRKSYADDKYLECAIRTAATTLYHPVGTTPVGSVLEADLRVKGLDNVYVSDGGVIDSLKDEFPNARIIRDALKLAEKLRNK